MIPAMNSIPYMDNRLTKLVTLTKENFTVTIKLRKKVEIQNNSSRY